MPVLEAKAAWLTACRASRSQRLPAGPPRIATKPQTLDQAQRQPCGARRPRQQHRWRERGGECPQRGPRALARQNRAAPQAQVGDPLGAHSWRSRSSPLCKRRDAWQSLVSSRARASPRRAAAGPDPANRRAGDPREQQSATAESHCWTGLHAEVMAITSASKPSGSRRCQPRHDCNGTAAGASRPPVPTTDPTAGIVPTRKPRLHVDGLAQSRAHAAVWGYRRDRSSSSRAVITAPTFGTLAFMLGSVTMLR